MTTNDDWQILEKAHVYLHRQMLQNRLRKLKYLIEERYQRDLEGLERLEKSLELGAEREE